MGLKIKTSDRVSQGKEKALKEVLSVNTVRINFDIDQHLHQRLKIKSVQENKTIKDIVVKLIDEYLN